MKSNSIDRAPLVVTVDEAATELRLSRAWIYRLIADGEIEVARMGVTRGTRIPYASLRALVERRTAEAKR